MSKLIVKSTDDVRRVTVRVGNPSGNIQGVRGLKGDKGVRGEKGNPGLDSTVPGPIGLTGLTGATGIQGIQGERGIQGIQGVKGEKGDTGPRGLTGPKGETGATGVTGAKGNAGIISAVSIATGLPDTTAKINLSGNANDRTIAFTIPRGSKGETGTINSVSATTGAPYTEALVSITGDPSNSDIAFTIPRGDKGVPGTIESVTVSTGAAYSEASVVLGGVPDNRTIALTIPRGDKGEKGDKGQGLDYNTMTPEDMLSIKGIKGDKGDTGAKGEIGLTGLKGDTGAKGATGTAASITGMTVTTGVEGSAASVVMGGTTTARSFALTIPRGDTGAKGETGDTGAKGDIGLTGDTGLQGIQGIQGLKGDTGAKGDSTPQTIPSASTTVVGIVKLNNTTTSTSIVEAATANSVKLANDLAKLAIPSTQRGIVNGVATLGADGKVTPTQLPAVVPVAWGNITGTLTSQTDLNSALSGKAATSHTHTPAQVGLGNVNNTADTAKPVSTAQQTALNGKADSVHTHTHTQISGLGTAATKEVGTATGNLVERDADGYPTNNNALGVGQTWQDVSGSRVKDTIYTNTTGRTIYFSGSVFYNSQNQPCRFYVGGEQVVYVRSASGTGVGCSLSAVIPNGSTYQQTGSSSLETWMELR